MFGMSEFKKMSIRIGVFACLIVVAFICVACSLYDLQIRRNDELLGKARQRYERKKTEHKMRGKILDLNGNVIVSNLHVINLAFDCDFVQDPAEREKIVDFLMRELPPEVIETHPKSLLLERIKSGDIQEMNEKTKKMEVKHKKYVPLVRNMDYIKVKDLQKNAEKQGIRGLIYEEGTKRVYPKKEMLSNIVGFTDQDEARSGIEKSMDKDLKQTNGTRSFEQSRTGERISFGGVENICQGRNGTDIYLTVREPLQAIMEEELDKMYKEFNAKAVYAIMVDPYTGDIMAIAQRPTFNPGDRSNMTGENAGMYNVRIAIDTFEPGSVIKPFVVAMGLDGGYINMDTKIDTGFGAWKYGGFYLHETHYIGTADPLRIIQNSSNIGTAMIALRMGEDELYKTFKTFHFGEKTGLPFGGEMKGIVRPVEKWGKVDITRMCIGHSMTVTPLQLARAYCMLANGGHDVNLRLIDATETDEEGKRPYKPQVMAKESVFKNPSTHKNLIKMMKTVPRPGGTAEKAAVPGYYVAGKTGTANKVGPGGYSKHKYFATFCGFVPADNPRFVLLVTCDEPQGLSVFGGSVSGPVFSRIAARALKYLNVAPEVPIDQWEKEWKKAVQDKWKEFNARDKERAERKAAGKSLFAPSMDSSDKSKKTKKKKSKK